MRRSRHAHVHRRLRRMAALRHGPLGGLGRFIGARLHRRLFLWFGLSIVATALVVAGVMTLLGGTQWREESARVQRFVGRRFAEAWEEPARRDALARGIAADLQVGVRLRDTRGGLLLEAGGACRRLDYTLPVARDDGTPLGEVAVCVPESRRTRPGLRLLPLLLAAGVLWLASGKIARRLARPLAELARAAGELGAGKLDTRVRLHPRDARGEAVEVAAAFNDMAARIQRQVAEQKELLAAVSHELRTPLGRLRVLAELLRSGDGKPSARTLDQVEREVVELDALVGELLASSRLDFGQLSKRALDPAQAALEALERAGLGAELLDVEPGAPREVDADPTLLARALANLLDNARRHGGGAVGLRVGVRGGRTAFWVEDAGPGLAPGEEARIFAPFYRKDAGARPGEGGTLGLGLALVRRIARAHGGDAFAENRSVNGARVGLTV